MCSCGCKFYARFCVTFTHNFLQCIEWIYGHEGDLWEHFNPTNTIKCIWHLSVFPIDEQSHSYYNSCIHIEDSFWQMIVRLVHACLRNTIAYTTAGKSGRPGKTCNTGNLNGAKAINQPLPHKASMLQLLNGSVGNATNKALSRQYFILN